MNDEHNNNNARITSFLQHPLQHPAATLRAAHTELKQGSAVGWVTSENRLAAVSGNGQASPVARR